MSLKLQTVSSASQQSTAGGFWFAVDNPRPRALITRRPGLRDNPTKSVQWNGVRIFLSRIWDRLETRGAVRSP